MQVSKTLTAAAVALGLTAGYGLAPAIAQDATEAPAGTTEAPAAAATFSDEKLDSFVMAALDVGAIQQRAAAELGNTADEAEQGRIIDEANSEVVGAIEATPGIDVDEFVAISEAAEADPDLGQRLQEKITAAQGG